MLSEFFFTGYLGKRVHLGVTGSVAAYKTLDIMRELMRLSVSVSVTLTESASRFVSPLSFQALGADPVFTGMFDETAGVFGHLAPGRTADCLAIVPATANTMAKMAHGIADDMLSTQALSFSGPTVIAPAMNPGLWEAPATNDNLATLLDRGVEVVFPGSGTVACGDSGKGRLAESFEIIACIIKAISPQDMVGKTVLLTLGPTREYFDPVRFWSNPSTGLMGGCLAMAAWLRGAEVTVVSGPCSLTLPDAIHVERVTSASEMYDATIDLYDDMDIACATAAVADFAPVPHGQDKFKKDAGSETLSFQFTRNKDILAELGRRKKPDQTLIGFAAETGQLEEQAKSKMLNKNLDMIVGNQVGIPGSGFAASSNKVVVLDKNGRLEAWPTLPKSEVAWRIWDHLLLF